MVSTVAAVAVSSVAVASEASVSVASVAVTDGDDWGSGNLVDDGGVVGGGSGAGSGGSGLVGVDDSAETMSVGDVADLTGTAVSIPEAVGSDTTVVGVGDFVTALVVAVVVDDVVAELVSLGGL